MRQIQGESPGITVSDLVGLGKGLRVPNSRVVKMLLDHTSYLE